MNVRPVKIPRGSYVHEYIRSIVKSSRLRGGFIFGIGALAKAEIGVYTGKEYVVERIEAPENRVIEVAPMMGNYVVYNGRVSVHIHATLSLGDGRVYSGHLVKGLVNPFIEALVIEVGDLTSIFGHRVKS